MIEQSRVEEKKVRAWIQTILRENRESQKFLVESDASSLYNVFVSPFTDVLKAAALTGQDILSVVRLQLDVLLTLSPKKQEEALKRFQDRSAKIDEKWKPIIEANEAALGSGDLAAASFILAPQAYLAQALAKSSAKGVKNIYQYLDEAGFTIPLMGALPGMPDNFADRGSAAGGGERETRGLITTATDTAKELAALFFGESYVPSIPLLEGEDENKKSGKKPEKEKPLDVDKELEKFFEDTGLKQAFEESAKDLVEAKKEHVEEIKQAAVIQLEGIDMLMKSTTVDEFEEAVEKLKDADIDLQATGLQNLRSEMDSQVQKLMTDEEFVTQLKKKKAGIKEGEENEDLPDISEKEAQEAAEKIVFVNAKEKVQEQLATGSEELKKSAVEAIKQGLPKDMSVAADTPGGKEIKKILDDAENEINAVGTGA